MRLDPHGRITSFAEMWHRLRWGRFRRAAHDLKPLHDDLSFQTLLEEIQKKQSVASK
jgi:hypothetical protein